MKIMILLNNSNCLIENIDLINNLFENKQLEVFQLYLS